jgi:peptidyl-prolyl cis-trans isomerase C
MNSFKTLFLTGLLLSASQSLMAQVVIEDQGVSLTQGELEYIVTNGWNNQMIQSAVNNEDDRLELLNNILIMKKIAQEADNISPDTEAYWRLSTTLMKAKRKAVLTAYMASLEVPDMSALAAERYEAQKEDYARVREHRTSSHILFAGVPGSSREDIEVEAQAVLDELRAGANFEEMVLAHSDDPGTKAKKGKFNKWMKQGDVGVAGPYSLGLFQIGQEGEYSELVNTKFGIHIIRLDGVREAYFKPYEEVKENIIADLEAEYRTLSFKDYNGGFNMTEDVYINGAAIDEILAPYAAKSE